MTDTGDVWLTRAGYEKLQKELAYLKGVKRKQLAQTIDKARQLGDLRENAEYHAAREASALNEAHVANLEDKLSRARILDDATIAADKAYIGATIHAKDLDGGTIDIYALVAEDEADPANGKISVMSPIGKGFLGHGVGERVEIHVPAGTLRYHIVKITRE